MEINFGGHRLNLLKDLTIVTVTKDNLKGMKLTKSSIEPILGKITWLIQDSNSTDGTRQYLNKIRDKRVVKHHESDSGIFHGMNKALNHVETKYVMFLNAGDQLSSQQALERCLNDLNISSKKWVVAGAMIADSNGNEYGYWETPKFPRYLRGLGVQSWCHQSTIYSTKFLKKNARFDEESLISDWSTALLLESIEPPLIRVEPIVKFLVGGVSSNIPRPIWVQMHSRGRDIAGLILTRKKYLKWILDNGTYWVAHRKKGSRFVNKVLRIFFEKRIDEFFDKPMKKNKS